MLPVTVLTLGFLCLPEALYQGEPTSVWISRLGGTRSGEAVNALKAIGRPAVGPTMKALENRANSDPMRWNSATVLGDLGADAKESVATLEKSERDDPNMWVRFFAARSLWKVVGRSEPVLSHIRVLSTDANPNARQFAAATARAMGSEAAPVLKELLEGVRRYPSTAGPPDTRTARFNANQEVFEAAVALGPGSIPVLIEALETPELSFGASQSLQRFGPKAREPLTAALKHSDPRVLTQVLFVLGQLKEQGRPAVPAIEGLLKSSDGFVQASAARAIWEISRTADRILPVLSKMLRDAEANRVHRSLALLADSGPLRTLLAYFKTLDDRDGAQLRSTLSLLADVGPTARDVIPELDRIALGDDVGLAGQAATALWKIAKDRRVEPLRRAVRQGGLANSHAFRTLGEMGADAAPAIPDLLEALAAAGSRYDARMALAKIGEPAVDPLIALLESHPDTTVRVEAVSVLADVGRPAARAVPLLRRLDEATDGDPSLRNATHAALKEILGSGAWGTGDLTKLLSTSKDQTQLLWAIEELRRLKTEAAPAIPALIRLLDVPEQALRRSAAAALAAIGRPAVQPLIRVIREGSERAVGHAAEALSDVEPVPKEAVGALLDRLSDPDPDARSQIANALVWIGTDDPRASEAYAEVLRTADLSSQRSRAVRGLGAFGPKALPLLSKALDDHRSDPRVLAAVAESLAKLKGDAATYSPQLVALLKTADPRLRLALVEALAALGIRRDDLGDVTPLLNDKEVRVATLAARAIGSLRADAKDAVPALRKALERKDGDGLLVGAIAETLGAIGPPAAAAADDLLRMVEGPGDDVFMKRTILLHLHELQPPPATVLPRLKRLWGSSTLSGFVRQQALFAASLIAPDGDERIAILAEGLSDRSLGAFATLELNKLGPKAAPAVPQLLKALKAAKPGEYTLTLATLEKIGLQESMLDPLIDVLDTGLPEERVRAINDVAALGTKAGKAVPGLRQRLRDDKEDPEVRAAAASAIRAVVAGQAADDETAAALIHALNAREDVVTAATAAAIAEVVTPTPDPLPRLITLLQGGSSKVRASAAYAIGRFGLEPDEALPALARALNDADDATANAAADALVGYGRPSVPLLLETLNDPIAEHRRRAAVVLGRVGRPATAAIPGLVGRLKDEDDEVANEAAGALGTVAPGVADTGDVSHILPLGEAMTQLERLKKAHRDPDLFERLAVQPVRQAWWLLVWRLVGYAAFVLAVLGVPALAYLMSGRLRRALWRRFNLGWAFATGRCEHEIAVETSPGATQVTLVVRTQGLAIVPRFSFPTAQFPDPDTSPDLQNLRIHVHRSRVRVEVDESEFARPWARVIGGPWSLALGAAIAGQLCRLSALTPLAQVPRRRLRIAAFGCKAPAPRHGITLEPLVGVRHEVEAISQRFKLWGADRLALPDRAGDQAEVEDFRQALENADVVHVSAHAEPDALYLADRALTAGDLDDTLLDRMRCRLLVLSACRLGDLGPAGSLVFPLVRRGVNVIASVAGTGPYSTREFYLGFYDSLLPWRSAEGVELAEAIRRGAAACARRYGVPPPGQTPPWVQSVDNIVLYGDPSFHLRLAPLRPATPAVSGSPPEAR